jgi:DNA repair exonuclease SbcCD ATPase subunit
VKTISVKEAALALGVSPRTIQYKLQNGDLKGSRTKNQFGVAEWRIWPTKEIADSLTQKQGNSEAISFAPTDSETIDAEDISPEGLEAPTNWRDIELERLEVMAEKLVKPLAERIETQAVALREQEKIIEEQKRQLRLLPDLEKRAENERKTAELKELEAVALQKQVAALKSKQDEAEQAKSKIEELEQALAETQRQSKEEIDRLKEEKEVQSKAVQEQLLTLTATVQDLKKPWWKKLFSAPEDGSRT